MNFDDNAWEYDPEFLRARAEMWSVLWLFLTSMIWTIGWSYFAGYQKLTEDEAKNISLLWGMPTWVFWGIFVPWITIDFVAIWFCFFYLQDSQTIDSEAAPVTSHSGTERLKASLAQQAKD
ncbi:MAG: hypothetical protein JNL67_23280 [Planctomycetaceae bacterium]|nr:hypothetical protein [Planctomycetaceae bacterium]